MKPHSQPRTLLVLRHAPYTLFLNPSQPRFSTPSSASYVIPHQAFPTNPFPPKPPTGENNNLTPPPASSNLLQFP